MPAGGCSSAHHAASRGLSGMHHAPPRPAHALTQAAACCMGQACSPGVEVPDLLSGQAAKPEACLVESFFIRLGEAACAGPGRVWWWWGGGRGEGCTDTWAGPSSCQPASAWCWHAHQRPGPCSPAARAGCLPRVVLRARLWGRPQHPSSGTRLLHLSCVGGPWACSAQLPAAERRTVLGCTSPGPLTSWDGYEAALLGDQHLNQVIGRAHLQAGSQQPGHARHVVCSGWTRPPGASQQAAWSPDTWPAAHGTPGLHGRRLAGGERAGRCSGAAMQWAATRGSAPHVHAMGGHSSQGAPSCRGHAEGRSGCCCRSPWGWPQLAGPRHRRAPPSRAPPHLPGQAARHANDGCHQGSVLPSGLHPGAAHSVRMCRTTGSQIRDLRRTFSKRGVLRRVGHRCRAD